MVPCLMHEVEYRSCPPRNTAKHSLYTNHQEIYPTAYRPARRSRQRQPFVSASGAPVVPYGTMVASECTSQGRAWMALPRCAVPPLRAYEAWQAMPDRDQYLSSSLRIMRYTYYQISEQNSTKEKKRLRTVKFLQERFLIGVKFMI